jgi:hypothetical protein
MRPYHPANLKLQPYAGWRVVILAGVGKLLGVQFHIRGIPFGAHRLSRVSALVDEIKHRPATNGITGER